MKIAVIDGMGGGIGSQTIEVIRSLNNKNIEIIALGTNSQATANMLRSGAHSGATGRMQFRGHVKASILLSDH